MNRTNCQTQQCYGVNEFVAVVDCNDGNTVQFVESIEESSFRKEEEPFLLIYRCSKCHRVSFFSNEGIEMTIKNQRIERLESYDREVNSLLNFFITNKSKGD